MSLPNSVIDALLAAGCSAEQLAAAVKASNAEQEDRIAERRAKDRMRKREARAAEKQEKSTASDLSDGQTRTDTDGADNLSSPEVSPQTPFPKPLQSVPPSPPKGGSSPAEVDQAFDAFASMAKASGIPAPRVLNDQRKRKMAGLIRTEGLPRVLEAIEAIGASDFCRGQNDRGWTADLDFLLQAKSFAGLLEGKYANKSGFPRGSPGKPLNASQLNRQRLETLMSQPDDERTQDRPRLIAAR